MFDPNSRYFNPAIPDAIYTFADGHQVAYRPLRTVPALDSITIKSQIESRINERPDQISARTLGDPELSWRILDANGVMNPLAVDSTWSKVWSIPSV